MVRIITIIVGIVGLVFSIWFFIDTNKTWYEYTGTATVPVADYLEIESHYGVESVCSDNCFITFNYNFRSQSKDLYGLDYHEWTGFDNAIVMMFPMIAIMLSVIVIAHGVAGKQLPSIFGLWR